MPLNLLLDGAYVIRHSAQPFTIGSGKTIAADSSEVLYDDHYTQAQTSVTLPTDYAPWFYTWDGVAFTKSDRYPAAAYTPGIPLGGRKPISRPRFDAVFAKACGEAYYQGVLDAIESIAATKPRTDLSSTMKRAYDAFSNPPSGGIDYPISDWTTQGKLDPTDLTGGFFALLSGALVGSFPDIKAKLIAGCNLWPLIGE